MLWQIKTLAAQKVFTSATEIAEEVVRRRLPAGAPCPSLPSIDNMARAANRMRRQLRPRHPSDLAFDLNRGHVPDQFRAFDTRARTSRHIVLATNVQLELLSRAKTWYVDGTFKVVRAPFTQLASIHAFIKKDGQLKQIPLCFIYMSRRKTKDYCVVLRKVIEVLPRPPAVSQVVSDFERAFWKATAKVLPWVKQRGCAFHWGQAIWRQIQQRGLATAYMTQHGVYSYCKKLLALPFLPATSIATVFDQLEAKANSPELQSLVTYIRGTWIDSRLWPPTAWSVYGQPVRTNNDVEGWHHRLNRKAGNNGLNMYLLFELLQQEAEIAELNVRLLSDRKVRRPQWKSTVRARTKLNRYWQEYEDGSRSVSRLLQACARLYAPQRVDQ